MSEFFTWWQLDVGSYQRTMMLSMEARIHDPQWLLARQLVTHEFAHDGGATPIDVRVDATVGRATVLRGNGSNDGPPVQLRLHSAPLESMVENEPVSQQGIEGLQLRKERGQQLQRMLRAAGLGEAARLWATRAPFVTPARGIDAETRAWFDAVAGRIPDGRALEGRINAVLNGTDPTITLVPGEREVIDAWRSAEVGATHRPRYNDNWDPERLEYRVTTTARLGGEEVAVEMPEYVEGTVDWYAFDRGSATLGAEGSSRNLRLHRLPVPLEFVGMPASRFWSFEDPSVNLDTLDLMAGDRDPSSAAMMALEFALTYGDDWYLVPIPLEPNTLCDLTSVVVTDCFGDRLTAQRPAGRWNLFRHDDRRAPGTLSTVSFHSAPVVVSEGEVLEELHFLRDEQANLAWAIEAIAPHPLGGGRERTAQPPPPAPPSSDGSVTWTLAPSTLPRHWFPLVPVQPGRLQLGTMWSARDARPTGRVLGELLPIPQRGVRLVHEEEIPMEGVQVTRRWQSARAVDGSLHFWVGRAKRPRQTEMAPGLRFDTVEY
jgi:hypothetical protein